MNIKIQKLESKDSKQLSKLLDLFLDVFEMEDQGKPSDEYFEKLLSDDSIIIFVALKNEQIIGGLTAYVMPQTYFKGAEVYVYDLAVKTDFQRQGIGAMLMKRLRNYCQEIGIREYFVQAYKEDEHAVDFYKKIGGNSEEIVHFSFPLESDQK